MTDVDRLLADYIAEHRAGGEADPSEYLSRASPAHRRELAVLIDAYLAAHRASRSTRRRSAARAPNAPSTSWNERSPDRPGCGRPCCRACATAPGSSAAPWSSGSPRRSA